MTKTFVDAIGISHKPAQGNVRIACLVPSITELLIDLGLTKQIVARTSFCIYPENKVETIPSVGGTKKVNQEKLKALHPTHLIVNIDENTKEMVDDLAMFIPNVIVTHPLKPIDNLELYRLMGGIFGKDECANQLCAKFEDVYQSIREFGQGLSSQKVLYFIWKSPWMTISRSTYISQFLALIKWQTVGHDSHVRYPIIEINDHILKETDIFLFSTEPYRFTNQDIDLFQQTNPHPNKKYALIDGAMTSWYGSRAIKGLSYLMNYVSTLMED